MSQLVPVNKVFACLMYMWSKIKRHCNNCRKYMEIHLHSTYLKTAKHQQNISVFFGGPRSSTGHTPRSWHFSTTFLLGRRLHAHPLWFCGWESREGWGWLVLLQTSSGLSRAPKSILVYRSSFSCYKRTLGVSPSLTQPQTSYSWLVDVSCISQIISAFWYSTSP
jgi:hypothetical protein